MERVPAARISDDFFKTLGVEPTLGRDFRLGEDRPPAQRTVLLSYAAWQARYGGRSSVLGESVTLNDVPYVIIGVLPRRFHFAPAEPADFWMSLHAVNPCERRRSCQNLYGVARLRDGVSLESASANIATVAAHLEQQYPEWNRGQGAAIVPLEELIVGTIRPVLIVLSAGVGLSSRRPLIGGNTMWIRVAGREYHLRRCERSRADERESARNGNVVSLT